MKRTAFLLAASLAFVGAALAADRYCSEDGTMMMRTGETSIHQNGDLYEKWECSGTEKHSRWYKHKDE